MKRTNVVKILQGGAVAACVALLFGWAALPGYSQYSCTPSSSVPPTVSLWTGFGTGDWNVAGNWLPTVVPDSQSTSACILNGTTIAPTTVNMGNNASDTINDLTLNKNNTLSISETGYLGVAGSRITNAGTITIGAAGTANFAVSVSLRGGGTIDLTDGEIDLSDPLTNVDNTIQGTGSIVLFGNSSSLMNHFEGVVDAVGGGIGVDGEGSLYNDGTFDAAAGSNLSVQSGVALTNFANGTLSGGTWDANGKIVLGALGTSGGEITTNAAIIILDGANGGAAAIVDSAGKDALSALALNESGLILENGVNRTFSTNLTNYGAINVGSGSTLNWNGGTNAGDRARLTVGDGATANVSSFTSSGVIVITGSGVVSNSGANLTLGSGSRTYVGLPGGTLSTVAGTRIELNGGLLDNNGTVSGALDVNYGSLAEGAGVYGAVNVGNGGTFHPGNSPGVATSSSATWGAGGAYQFDINDAAGTPGTNWSLWNVTGNLDITAGTTPDSRFTIDINSLLANDSPGLLANFNPDDPYTWLIASAGSVTGFNPADFAFDTAGFENPLDGGAFSLADGPTNLDLIFTPKTHTVTPEPSTLSLLAIGALGLAIYLRRGKLRAV